MKIEDQKIKNKTNDIQKEEQKKEPSMWSKNQLDEELPESRSKENEFIKGEFEESLGENVKYLEWLKGTPYNFTANDGFICKELVNKEISNAFIYPLKLKNYIDIESTKSVMELQAIISPTGEVLPPITMSIADIENGNWMTDPIWWRKIINKIPFQKNAQVNCIKELTKYIEVEHIYLFAGLVERNNKKMYMHPGGAIGTDEVVKVDLGDTELNRLCLSKREFDLKECCSLKFLEVAPLKITLPILALTYKAVLSSIFEELGINTNFLTVVTGSKSSEKLNLVLGVCNTFGNFRESHMPIKLTDSESEIKDKVTKCRDMLLPCTGYIASSNRAESNQIARSFDTLIKINEANGAKATLVIVADKVPDVFESYKTNVLIINVKNEDINKEKLYQVLEHQGEWQYFMKKFLENLCANYEEIKIEILEIFKSKVNEVKEDIQLETAEAIAELYVGYAMLIDFASKNKIVTVDEKEKMLKEGWNTLVELAKEQESVIEEESLIKKTLSAIEILTNARKLTTVDYKDADSFTEQELMKDGFVGYFNIEKDGTKLALIYPDLLYKEVKNFYNQQGLLFPWTQADMCKDLFVQDYLYKTGKQMRPQVRRYNPRTDKEETFIGLLDARVNIACRFKKQGIILTR